MDQAEKIEKAIAELAVRENAFAKAAEAFAEAEGAYRFDKAAAFLAADGTVAEREAVAIREVARQHKAKLTAEVTLELTKQKLLDVRSVLSARQSILSAAVRVHEATRNFTA